MAAIKGCMNVTPGQEHTQEAPWIAAVFRSQTVLQVIPPRTELSASETSWPATICLLSAGAFSALAVWHFVFPPISSIVHAILGATLLLRSSPARPSVAWRSAARTHVKCVRDNSAGSEKRRRDAPFAEPRMQIGRALARPARVRAMDGAYQNPASPLKKRFHNLTRR